MPLDVIVAVQVAGLAVIVSLRQLLFVLIVEDACAGACRLVHGGGMEFDIRMSAECLLEVRVLGLRLLLARVLAVFGIVRRRLLLEPKRTDLILNVAVVFDHEVALLYWHFRADEIAFARIVIPTAGLADGHLDI